MANNTSGNDNSDERNPFVAFRHFADEHISAALGALSDANTDIWKRLEDAEGDARKAWKRFNDSYDRATSPERLRTEPDSNETSTSTSATAHHYEWPSQRQERDLAWSGWGPENWPAMRFGFDRFFDRPGPWRPSLEFMARNRYSPLVLEQRWPTEQDGTKWRQAFEDLLKADRGETVSELVFDMSMDKKEPPEDWLKRLISNEMVSIRRDPWFFEEPKHPWGWHGHGRTHHESGSGGPPWRATKVQREEGKTREANTELDLYEHFLGDRSSTPAYQTELKLEGEIKPQGSPAEKPSVIATMTTTEQRMLADGTVTTKTVLKKKFSDGTEESKETRNTIPGAAVVETSTSAKPTMIQPVLSHMVAVEPDVKDKVAVKDSETLKAKKNNWFWSGSS